MAEGRGPLFVLGLVGAIGLGVALGYLLERGERRSARRPQRPAVEAGTQGEPREPHGALERGTEARSAVPGGPAGAPAEVLAVPPELPAGELVVRVLDDGGRPLAGARVALARTEARELALLDPLAESLVLPVAQGVTDGTGLFRCTLARGLAVDVSAVQEGVCDALATDAYAGQELELVLAPGVLVSGRLTRARDGSPVEGARVRVFRPGRPASLERETLSRADGRYALRTPLRTPSSEDAVLEVIPLDLACSGWIELAIGADERCERDVELADGLVVTGRVMAAGTLAPVAGATIGEGGWFRRTATTDAHGEYRLSGFGDLDACEVSVRARGFRSARTADLPAAVDGVIRLDLVLESGHAVGGRVVDERGAPVDGAYVAAVASEPGPLGQRTDRVSSRTDARGRYRIEGLARELPHALLVVRHGYGTQVHDLPESELAAEELELPDVVLRAPALLGGRVEGPAGPGLAEVEVVLTGANHDRQRFARAATARAQRRVDTRTVRTDAQGRFWFGDLAAGSYQLTARAAGRPESAPLALELGPRERREDLVLRLDPGAVLRGQVVGERGNALAGVYVSALVERLADPLVRPPGYTSVRTGADGRFELAGLPAGEYTLQAHPLEVPSADPREPWLAATLEHATTGEQPIRIQLARGASIGGRLLDAHGAPLPGRVVATVGGDGRPEELGQTDADGRFALTVPKGTTWTLEVRGPPQSAAFRKVLLTRRGVAAGTQELELRLER